MEAVCADSVCRQCGKPLETLTYQRKGDIIISNLEVSMDKSITKQLIYTARQAQLCIGIRMEKYGITAAEEPFFMAIQRYKGATQEELTSLVGVDKAATARAISSLERKGYLTRQRDETDRRQNRIYAADQALNMGTEVREELMRLNNEILNGISEGDRTIMYRALLKMAENLKIIKKGERSE